MKGNDKVSRFGLYGDLPTIFLYKICPLVPSIFEFVLVPIFAFFFYLIAGKQRRAVVANLRVIKAERSSFFYAYESFKVFENFAWMMTDSARAHIAKKKDKQIIAWSLRDPECMSELSRTRNARVFLTAHMGLYDAAAPIFLEKLALPLNIVRLSEQRSELDELRRDELNAENLRIHFSNPGRLLIFDLIEILRKNEHIAIQGDRVMPTMEAKSCLKIPYPNFKNSEKNAPLLRLPKGVFILAAISARKVFPIFVARKSWRAYEIICGEEFEVAPKSRADREECIEKAAQNWTNQLAKLLSEHHRQWFVFENAFVENTH